MSLKSIYIITIVLFLNGCATRNSGLQITASSGFGDRSSVIIKGANGGLGEMSLWGNEAQLRGHVNVVLTNKSPQELSVWPQYSREGLLQIEFIFKDVNGITYQVKNREVSFKTYEEVDPIFLKPNDMCVLDCFIQGWEWKPSLPTGKHKLKGVVIFNSIKNLGNEARSQFYGIVKSEEFELVTDTTSVELFK
jgi:hypothetical protein